MLLKLFAGYDGGGTKTASVLVDETGRLLGTGVGGPSNYLYCGKEMAATSVKDATQMAFTNAGLNMCKIECAYMASAAILLAHGESHVPFFSSCIDANHVICESDIYPIWYGSVREAPAVISIAGTGAITYVCSKEGFFRVSGYGPLLGDEGSGYDLALRGIRLACRMYDDRIPCDEQFLNAVFEHYGVRTPLELLRVLNKDDVRSKVASFARVIFDLYTSGNPVAAELLEASADEIALAVRTAAEKANCKEPLPVVFSGSLVHPDRAVYPMLRKRLLEEGSPICSVHSLEVHPAVAAAALALHSQGYDHAAEVLLQKAKGVLL